MKKIILFLSIVALIFSCNSNKTDNTSKTASSNTNFKAEISFDGSSSLAPVMASIGTKFMEEYVTWDKVSSNLPNEKISIYVSSAGSGAGVKSILDNTASFGMLARKIRDSEKTQMTNYKEFLVASDALTVSVNAKNPIVQIKDNLDSDTIRKIFSGEYKYWSDVDASLPQKEIVVIIRDLSGGAYEVFQESIMGETQISPNAIQSPSMGALGTKIVENENAIGYASYGVYNQNKDNLFAFKVDGVEPTKENILNGQYKIQRPLMFIKNSELSESENAFVNYVFSDIGKQVVEENGYIPVE
ncbi:phosphate ABC transporter substrate-binding protein [Brachyspira sp. G79]|uniref:phosphate ABC transporter substrate-binding protein n=1 Tax=Brachyspira sp. G79 TaxID=1358104 RepID=UPI000BBBA4D6|nr:phosphate ABC transporter substrate-binding protein [Brachyspira sp. G79]PCG20436.1 ABC transporter substrate-binding protein [Brachyspira sp. G79]